MTDTTNTSIISTTDKDIYKTNTANRQRHLQHQQRHKMDNNNNNNNKKQHHRSVSDGGNENNGAVVVDYELQNSGRDHIKHDEHNHYWKKINNYKTKMDSGITDAATYHHGSEKQKHHHHHHNHDNEDNEEERRILGQHHNNYNPIRGIISACTSA